MRYVITDLATGAVIGDLPLHDVQWTTVLNGAGPATAKLRIPIDEPVLAAQYLDATTPGRRALYIETESVVAWAGPIWKRDYNTETQDLVLAGAEMWSYWRRRRIRWADTFDTDQLRIVRHLLTQAQQQLGGSIAVLVGTGTSGVPRDAVFNPWDDKNLGEAIEQLAELSNGFDFWIQVVPVDAGYERRLRLAHPERGRTIDDQGTTPIVWTLGNNMRKLEVPEDATRQVNSLMGIGAGQGVDMIRALATDIDALNGGAVLLEDNITYKDIIRASDLHAHAHAELAVVNTPVSMPTAIVYTDDDPTIGTFEPGDQALLRVMPDTDPRWPNGVEITVRIYSISAAEPNDGTPAMATVTFCDVIAYQPGTAIPLLGATQATWEGEIAFWDSEPIMGFQT